MKKRLLIVSTVLTMSFFMLTSCGKKDDSQQTSTNTESTSQQSSDKSKTKADDSPKITSSEMKEFFPFSEGTKLNYTSTSDSKTVEATVKSVSDNTMVISHEKDSKIEFSNEGIQLDGGFILKLPVQKNASWDSSNGKVTIKNTGYILGSPIGNLNTVEVSVEGGNTYYIAKNLGIVKIETSDKKVYELTSISSDISKSSETNGSAGADEGASSEEYKVSKLYYYDAEADGMVYYATEGNVNESSAPRFFEDKFKNPPNENVGQILPPSTKINSIKVDKEKSMVTMDVSEAFTDSMNLGASSETGILQGIANTLGDTYGCKSIVITVNGGEFTTGHSIISAEEPLVPDSSNAKEAK